MYRSGCYVARLDSRGMLYLSDGKASETVRMVKAGLLNQIGQNAFNDLARWVFYAVRASADAAHTSVKSCAFVSERYCRKEYLV